MDKQKARQLEGEVKKKIMGQADTKSAEGFPDLGTSILPSSITTRQLTATEKEAVESLIGRYNKILTSSTPPVEPKPENKRDSAVGVNDLIHTVAEHTDFEDYKADDVLNLDRLKKMFDRMRGTESVSEYAKRCGCAPSTLFRLLKGEIKVPTKQMLLACYENAVPYSDVTLDAWFRAAGYVQTGKLTFVTDAKEQRRTAKMIMSSNRVESGMSVKQVDVEPWDRYLMPPDFILATKDDKNTCDPTEELFYIIDVSNTRTRRGESDLSHLMVSRYLRNIRTILGGAYLEHALNNSFCLGFIVFDRVSFNELVERLEDLRVTEPMTVYCVDIKENRIAEQYTMTQIQ